MPEMLAGFIGAFHADRRDGIECAWLGDTGVAYVWPAGYNVRSHPTELVNAKGHVIAREGEVLSFAGGVMPGEPTDPGEQCRTKTEFGWQFVAIEGLPSYPNNSHPNKRT
jgi:hypothetical protein